jgi:hypothetical protein
MSPLEKNVPNGNMFASSGISHAHTDRSFVGLLRTSGFSLALPNTARLRSAAFGSRRSLR